MNQLNRGQQQPPVDHYQVQPRAYHAAIAKLQSLPYQEVAELMNLLATNTRIMYKTVDEPKKPDEAKKPEPPEPKSDDDGDTAEESELTDDLQNATEEG